MSKRDFNTGTEQSRHFRYYILTVKDEILIYSHTYNPQLLEADQYVKIYWKVNDDSSTDLYKMLVRAYTEGGNRLKISEIIKAANITDQSCKEHIIKDNLSFAHNGNTWTVFPATHTSSKGIGKTLFEAYCEFYDQAVHV